MTTFDILILCDPRFPGGTSTAIAAEIRAQHAAGYTTGLLAIKGGILRHPHPYHRELRALLDQGAAVQVDPDQPVQAALAVVHHPQLFSQLPVNRLRIDADMVLLVVHHPAIDGAGQRFYEVGPVDRNLKAIFGMQPVWAPIGPTVRSQLQSLDAGLNILPFDWVNVIDPKSWSGPRHGPLGSEPKIGRHSRPDPLKWPKDRAAILEVYPDDPAIEVAILGGGAFLDEIMQDYPTNWRVIPFDGMAVAEFLNGIDFFIFYHHPDWVEAFGRTILEALASGCVVILPPEFQALFGDAARYAQAHEVKALVRELHSDPDAFAAQSRLGHERLCERFSNQRHVRRLADEIALPARQKRQPRMSTSPRRHALFVSSNGIGLGHLTRLLAIARRLDPHLKPIFATMSQAISLVEDAGYLAEHIPFHVYLEVPSSEWNRHLTLDLREIVAFYRPAILIFDGNVPYQGLLDCMSLFPAMLTVWSRRGFWRHNNDAALLKRDAAFDLVIEPGDLAAEMDHGPTTTRRTRVRSVAPIRLFDACELLPRAAAKEVLGLDPDKMAVLMQLGSGNNTDIQGPAAFLATLGETCRHIELVHVQNPISLEPLTLPDWVTTRRIYPLGQHLAAFDGVVSAAGYNSYHELLLAGCPTLFIPNENPMMDDQMARSRYAERQGWALAARAHDVYEMRRKFLELLEPETQMRLRRQLTGLEQPNGADEAATIVQEYGYLARADLN